MKEFMKGLVVGEIIGGVSILIGFMLAHYFWK